LILVIGDALIDKYVYAVNTRRSPEDTNAAIWDVLRRVECPGGCLNVAANLASLTSEPVYLSAIVQQDTRNWLKEHYNIQPVEELCATTSAPLTKERLIDSELGNQVLRIDNRTTFTNEAIEAFENQFKRHSNLLAAFDAIVISDYCKGTITDRIVAYLESIHCPVFVDTKFENLAVWDQIKECYVKINGPEYVGCRNPESVNLIVTHGSEGSVYYPQDGSPCFAVHGSQVSKADCIGAGDAYLAGLVDGYVAQSLPIDLAMLHADLVARASVRQFGTSIVTQTDVEQEIWNDYHGHAGQNNRESKLCTEGMGV
jgi:bifunctional ADP-heptose synthase (sugar kinase/adenylyltransferase)